MGTGDGDLLYRLGLQTPRMSITNQAQVDGEGGVGAQTLIFCQPLAYLLPPTWGLTYPLLVVMPMVFKNTTKNATSLPVWK